MDYQTDLAQINHENAIARYLGEPVEVIQQSQVTGELFGVRAPKHFKIGNVAFYEKRHFDKWLGQFAEQTGSGL